MAMQLTTAQEALVTEIAERAGMRPADVIDEALFSWRFADDEQEQQIIDARLAEADAGVDWISQEEMGERIKKMLEH